MGLLGWLRGDEPRDLGTDGAEQDYLANLAASLPAGWDLDSDLPTGDTVGEAARTAWSLGARYTRRDFREDVARDRKDRR